MFKKKGIYPVIAILAIAIFFIQFDILSHPTNDMGHSQGFSYEPGDSLMHYKDFKRILDSIKRDYYWNENKNKGKIRTGVQTSMIGAASINDCKDCTHYENSPLNKYYLVLPGYALNDPGGSSFYVESDKNYISYTIWDSIWTRNGNNAQRRGHTASKQVPFRFSSDEKDWKGEVLIPVRQQTYRFLIPLIYCCIALLTIFMLYVTIGLPTAVLIRISTGKAFVPVNIRQLKFVASTLVCFPFIDLLFRFILKLSFHRYITSDLDFLWLQILYNYRYLFVAGIVLFFIARAFKEGYNLQKDQDLTI